jgi:hypothetical protein
LVLNVEKTNLLKFKSSKSTFYPLNLFSANHSLTEAATIKFLGLQLDSQQTWKAHTHFLLNKLSSVCYIMRRMVHILNLETLNVVYFAHFHSLISYGIIFWGNSLTVHNVFLIQKRILRIMLELGPRCSCSSQFVILNILQVPSLYIFLLIMSVHNNLDNFKTDSLIRNFNTTSKNQLHLPTVHLASIQKSVTYSALSMFNALPTHLLQLQTEKVLFKLALRKFLLVNAFYPVDEFLAHSRNTV